MIHSTFGRDDDDQDDLGHRVRVLVRRFTGQRSPHDRDKTRPPQKGYVTPPPPSPWRRWVMIVLSVLGLLGIADRTGAIPVAALIRSVIVDPPPGRQRSSSRPPAPPPPGDTTAICRDGSASFSQHASGTCSGRGGVLCWIHHPGVSPPTTSPFCTSLAGRREEQL